MSSPGLTPLRPQSLSSSPSPPPLNHRHRTVTAKCRRCSNPVFKGLNLWLKITRTYHLPAFAASYKLPGLRAVGHSRPASGGTLLSSCQIQPLVCSLCNDTLGITCTNSPDDKTRFKDRDFLKLTKVSLIAIHSGAQVDPTLERAMLEEHRTESVVHPIDSVSRSVGSPATRPYRGPMHSASSRTSEPQRHAQSPVQHGGQQYRPSAEDMFNQLQSQLHLHSNILEDQRTAIERIDAAVQRLQGEQGYMVAAIQDMTAELQSRPLQPPSTDVPDSNEIDMLTEQLHHVASKANEVEGLKLEVSIMRRQLRRLERMDRHGSPARGLGSAELQSHEHAHPAAVPPHVQPASSSFTAATPPGPEQRPVLYQTPAENRLPPPIMPGPESRTLSEQHVSAESRTLPSFRSIDPSSSSTLSSWRPAGGYTPGHPTSASGTAAAPATTPTSNLQAEAPTASSWAAVNATTVPTAPKRSVPADGPATISDAAQPTSPKRQRLAPLMPRMSYGDQNSTGTSSPYQVSGATPDSLPQVPSLVNSRNPSNESQGSLPPPSNPLRFVLSTQDAPSEDSWRPESQRATVEAARGGARGSPRRGRGGNRGRSRKSGGGEELGTPEWEGPGWTGSQVAPNGYYQPGAMTHAQEGARGNLVRRAGGHVGGGSDRPHGHPGAPVAPMPLSSGAVVPETQVPQSSLYPDPQFMPLGATMDAAGSTISGLGGGGGHNAAKKTRTKPIRNADGVLIRKDGRPDMRSVSSAMNLKKVHAKKEAERQSKEASTEGGKDDGTPQSHEGHDAGSFAGSPDGAREGEDSDMSGDEDNEVEDNEEARRHAANMRKIFPYGIDGHGGHAFLPSATTASTTTTLRGDSHAREDKSADHGHPDRHSAVPSREKGAPGQGGEDEKMVQGAGVGGNRVVEERRDVEMGESGAEGVA